MPTWFMHDISKTASSTEHSFTVVLAVPYTTTMGGETIVHILAKITGRQVCVFPVTPDTVGATQTEMKGADM